MTLCLHCQGSLDRARSEKEDCTRDLMKFCGLAAVHALWGEFRSKAELDEHHSQRDNLIHVGVMASVADRAAGC
jgi:acyl-coenzyme A thioesterase PaaI-like protein